MWRRYRPLRIISPVAFLIIWEGVVRLDEVNQLIIPAPASVLRTMIDLTIDGRLPWAIIASLNRVLQGFIYGSLLGIVLGLLVGWFRAVEDAVDPLVAATYPIPKSALFPLFMLWFGLGETSKVITILIGVLFLVLINTVTGVKAIDPVLLKAARDLGANQRQIFTKVVIPGALPNIFTGLRLGAGMALILVFITELEATKAGLGFLLWESYQLLLVKQVFSCTIAFGILGILSSWMLQWLERAVCPWKRV
ncbi:MAG: ABC transporter permease [Deltaproteobacteria bacterium]|nr:MAG: ABC transporter permease [Deltaproteobacteria bacterium]